MREVNAPHPFDKDPKESTVFLSGSTGSENWRAELLEMLKKNNPDALFLNPYRQDYPKMVKDLKDQFAWESDALVKSDIVIYYFDDSSVAPLTLLEMGLLLNSNKTIFVGYNPNYSPYFEVSERLKIFRPEVKPVHSLKELAKNVNAFLYNNPRYKTYTKLASRRK